MLVGMKRVALMSKGLKVYTEEAAAFTRAKAAARPGAHTHTDTHASSCTHTHARARSGCLCLCFSFAARSIFDALWLEQSDRFSHTLLAILQAECSHSDADLSESRMQEETVSQSHKDTHA